MAGYPKGVVALFFCAFAVAACNATPPNDVASGVGFQDYQQWQARRAMLRGEQIVPPKPPAAAQTAAIRPPIAPVTAALPPLSQPPRPPASVAPPPPQVAAAPTLPQPAPAAAPTPTPASVSVAPPRADLASIAAAAIASAEAPTPPPASLARTGPTRISDEQDFDAVAERETIESDAERLARMQAERVVIAPTAIPERPADIGPNIIDYALATSHPVGERRHTRRPITQARHTRACLGFRSADLAQEWFLQNGGPGRDRQGLDPDGDGFACDWNPAPYRAAAAAARN